MDAGRSEAKRCAGTRRDGSPCQAPVLGQGTYCFAHAPDQAEKRAAARQRGGRHSASLVRLRHLVPPKLLTVYEQLEAALQEVHDGTLPPSRGVAMAAIARAMVAVFTSGEQEERLRRLEGRAG